MKNQPTIYGYARVSTNKQKIERQIENIKARAPEAVIIEESFTGTKMDRPKWSRLYSVLKPGDTVIFDEVSRMSRNAEEGFTVYQELYNRGINLQFLKEPFIDTAVYRDAAQRRIEATVTTGNRATDNFTAAILEAVNQLLMDLARQQIEAAFSQAQAEVDHLHQRTSEGVRRAQERYKRETALGLPHEKENVGRATGATITTKKSLAVKELIRKYSRDFNGTLSDIEVIDQIRGKGGKLSRNSYYKYKRELIEEATEN